MNADDTPTVNLQKLKSQAHGYTELFAGLIRRAEPRAWDRLLEVLNEEAARQARLQRIREAATRLDDIARTAEHQLRSMLSLARLTLSNVERSNETAIGRLVRGREQLKIAREKLALQKIVSEETRAFFVAKGLTLPSDERQWGKLNVEVFLSSGDDLIVRARHQQRWVALINAIAAEESIHNELVAAEQSYRDSSAHERICNGFIERCESELRILDARVQDLKAAITLGSLTAIERFVEDSSRGHSIKMLETVLG